MKRRQLLVILTFIIIGVAVGIFFIPWYKYYKEVNREFNNWYVNQYKPLSLNGVVVSIQKNDEGDFVNLRLKSNGEVYAFGLCIDDKSIINNLKVGDKIVKESGNERVTLYIDSTMIHVKLPFCPLL